MGAPKKRGKRRRPKRTPSQARLGQHFFVSGSIARRIIRSIGLRSHQTVLELGAGEGFFTRLIAAEVRSVTAIDIDPRLISRLNSRFKDTKNVTVIRKSITSTINFSNYDVVFWNIPFNRTADIFRKLSRPPVGFSSCHLIVQTDAAYRLVGTGPPSEMSLLAYPYLDARLGMSVPRWAYSPQPSVDSSVMHVRTRPAALVSTHDFRAFRAFVKNLLRSGTRNLWRVVGDDFSYSRWRQICARLNIKPSDSHLALNMRQHVELFDAINALKGRGDPRVGR